MSLLDAAVRSRAAEQVRDIKPFRPSESRKRPPLRACTVTGCPNRTRDVGGECKTCRATAVQRLTVEELRTIIRNAQAELQRRSAEVADALGEVA